MGFKFDRKQLVLEKIEYQTKKNHIGRHGRKYEKSSLIAGDIASYPITFPQFSSRQRLSYKAVHAAKNAIEYIEHTDITGMYTKKILPLHSDILSFCDLPADLFVVNAQVAQQVPPKLQEKYFNKVLTYYTQKHASLFRNFAQLVANEKAKEGITNELRWSEAPDQLEERIAKKNISFDDVHWINTHIPRTSFSYKPAFDRDDLQKICRFLKK
ncbi:MAG: hypothetical protein ACOCQQ_03725 [Candidatus Nanoarchaeia archaeon]